MSTPAVPSSVTHGSLVEAHDVHKAFGQTPAFGVITLTLPLLRKMTAPSAIRFE